MRILLFVAAVLGAGPAVAQGRLGGPSYSDITVTTPNSSGPIPNMTVVPRGATIGRRLADRFADRPNVLDFGARLDGATDDRAAFSAARAAAGDRGSVDVPPGAVRLNGTPTGGSAGPILWRLSGNTSGGYPLTGIGNDIVETFIERSKYFGQSETKHENSPVVRIDQRISHSHTVTAGAPELVIPAFKIYQFVEPSGQLDDFPWALSTTTRSKAYGKAQIVGIAAQMIRPSDALADGKGPRSQLWGGYIEVNDETGRPSNESGAMVGIEMGMFANAGDPGGGRTAFDIGIGRRNGAGPAARFNRGLHFGSADAQYGFGKVDHSFLGRVISIEANWDVAALDTTGGLAIGGAPAIRLADGHRIAFDAGGAHHLRWEAAGLRYVGGNAELFNVLDDGTVNIAGRLKPAQDVVLSDAKKIFFDSGMNHHLRWEAGGLRYAAGGVELFNILDDGAASLVGRLRAQNGITLSDAKSLAFDAGGAHTLRWEGAGLRYAVGNNEVFNILDSGRVSFTGPLNIPDQSAPANTADARGVIGDEIRSGNFLYRKTSGGWMRTTLSNF